MSSLLPTHFQVFIILANTFYATEMFLPGKKLFSEQTDSPEKTSPAMKFQICSVGPFLVFNLHQQWRTPRKWVRHRIIRAVPVPFGCLSNLVHLLLALFLGHLLRGMTLLHSQPQAISCALWCGDLELWETSHTAGWPTSDVHPGPDGSLGSKNILSTP